LIGQIRQTFGLPLRVIHITRNPYDNIAAISRRSRISIQEAIKSYFRKCDTVRDIRPQLNDKEWFEMSSEEFVSDAKKNLADLCGFLGVEAGEAYLHACSTLVKAEPSETRHKVSWTGEELEDVAKRMREYAFLEPYPIESGVAPTSS
jgi:hypothetical protein